MIYVDGDACHVEQFGDCAFDVVFSSSVSEHIGAETQMETFAREVHRLGRAYWVQTPAKWFPIEAHCGMLFQWFYPDWLRRNFLARWRDKLPGWTRMVEETRVLTPGQLQRLFPDAQIHIERFFGIPKFYAVFIRPVP